MLTSKIFTHFLESANLDLTSTSADVFFHFDFTPSKVGPDNQSITAVARAHVVRFFRLRGFSLAKYGGTYKNLESARGQGTIFRDYCGITEWSPAPKVGFCWCPTGMKKEICTQVEVRRLIVEAVRLARKHRSHTACQTTQNQKAQRKSLLVVLGPGFIKLQPEHDDCCESTSG